MSERDHPMRDFSKHPYRESQNPEQRRYPPRWVARLRGFYRRVVAPTKFVVAVGLLFGGCDWMCHKDAIIQIHEQEREAKVHFGDWQKAIDENQHKNDIRQAELDIKEREFKQRAEIFEIILKTSSLSPQEKDARVNIVTCLADPKNPQCKK